jgi:hypothetical protein
MCHEAFTLVIGRPIIDKAGPYVECGAPPPFILPLVASHLTKKAGEAMARSKDVLCASTNSRTGKNYNHRMGPIAAEY